MNDPWKHLKPRDYYTVVLNDWITDTDIKIINRLYQPIIGTDAFALLHSLFIEAETALKGNQRHNVLLNRLDIGLPRLYEARLKLEGIGLMTSYVKPLDEDHHFMYVLQKPLEPKVFLKDDVLSLLLLEKIGEDAFLALRDSFLKGADVAPDYQPITKKFLDVYQVNSYQLESHEALLKHEGIEESASKDKGIELDIKKETFDWDFFKSLLKGMPISPDTMEKELQKSIDTFHYLYGIDEMVMSDYIQRAFDFVTGTINISEFKKSVYKEYHQKKRPKEPLQAPVVSREEEVASKQMSLRETELSRLGYSKGEVGVLIACEKTPPMVFLKAIKKQKNGYVANNERWTIENLKNQSGLPNSVINMLIHYMLVVQGNSSLNQNMVNSIANDWAQSKVKTAEEGLQKVKALKQEKEAAPKRNTYSKKGGQGKSSRKETLPDWAKEGNAKVETPVSAEDQAFFEEQLRLLQTKSGGDS